MSELGGILGYKFWAILRDFVQARGLVSRFPLSHIRSFELIQSLRQFINYEHQVAKTQILEKKSCDYAFKKNFRECSVNLRKNNYYKISHFMGYSHVMLD